MIEWSEGARQALQRHVDGQRVRWESSGADPAEVADNLRHHIEAEMQGAVCVTEHDVSRILARMEPVGEESAKPVSPVIAKKLREMREIQPFERGFMVFAGMLLPVITLGFEIATGMCAEFLNPIPTLGHIVAVALVPFSVCWAQYGSERHLAWRGFFSAMGMAIAFCYTILFLPLIPIAVMTIIALGLGFLPMSPLLALLASLLARRAMRRSLPAGMKRVPRFWLGLACGLAWLAIIESPALITDGCAQFALSKNASTRSAGLGLLRGVGSEQVLRRACHGETVSLMDWLVRWVEGPVNTEKYREVYYRAYGRQYHAVPHRASRDGVRLRGRRIARFAFDEELGGSVVGGRREGLLLRSSRMDGSIDADGGVAYLEWTLEFKNENGRPAEEARALIALPEDGVVSRLTLWVNDVEQEAAFGSRDRTVSAYQNVAVRERRDPALLTTQGPGRVLLQCFPVLAGKSLKVRFGISAPVAVTEPAHGMLALPRFVDRNFVAPPSVTHQIWMESKSPLTMPAVTVTTEHPKDGVYAVRGAVAEAELAGGLIVEGARNPGMHSAFVEDVQAVTPTVIVQTLESRRINMPKRVAIVIDGSWCLNGQATKIADALRGLPADAECQLWQASDTPRHCEAATPAGVADWLEDLRYQGGQDNVPALVAAWDWAAPEEGGLICWLHGPQPMEFTPIQDLLQRWQRRPAGPRLLAIPLVPGTNRVLAALEDFGTVRYLPRRHRDVWGDVAAEVAVWGGEREFWFWNRHAVSVDQRPSADDAKPTSAHLTRLWVRDQILAGIEKLPAGREALVETAVRYQLVTPLTGAVVLEREEQYTANDLQQVMADSVPSVPEPETWVLLIAAVIVIAVMSRRRGPA